MPPDDNRAPETARQRRGRAKNDGPEPSGRARSAQDQPSKPGDSSRQNRTTREQQAPTDRRPEGVRRGATQRSRDPDRQSIKRSGAQGGEAPGRRRAPAQPNGPRAATERMPSGNDEPTTPPSNRRRRSAGASGGKARAAAASGVEKKAKGARSATQSLSPAMSAAAAARAKVAGDEDSTIFFPGPADYPTSTKSASAPPGVKDFDSLSDFDEISSRYDAPDPFAPLDDLTKEPTPALLAAKAEPLGAGSGGRAPSRAKPGRQQRPSRSAKGAEAVRASKAKGRPSSKRKKPREPSKLVLGLGVLVVILAGVGAAYFLTRGDGDPNPTGDQLASDDGAGLTDDSLQTSDALTEEEVAAPATGFPAVVIFDEAAVGPIQANTSYQIAVGDGPGSAQYQLLVDGIPEADPAPELPPVIFEAGRHLLVIEITSPEGSSSTDPVVVYAVGEIPGVGFRANLSSVNVEAEGWAEAVRQFDEFVAAGHTDLELMPSDWFASLVPGYWNIFVGGFDSSGEATDYCDGFGLAVPDQCFSQRFDPDAPAGG